MRPNLSGIDEASAAPLAATLEAIAHASRSFEDPWWIFGSVAARLLGADIREIADVDLLLSPADADRLAALWRDHPLAPPPAPSEQFRSAHFRRYLHAPLAVEAVAGFEMREFGKWAPVAFQSRIAADRMFVPDRAEQIALLKRMGRAKDGPRIAALEAHGD